MKRYRGLFMVIGLGILSGLSYPADAFTGQQYADQAQVTLDQARAKALEAAPGTIQTAELEKEPGGSGLRYTFDIKTPSGLREVGIDAQTGKLVENAIESSQTESRERQAEHGTEHDRTGAGK